MTLANLIAMLYDRGKPHDEVAVVLSADAEQVHLEAVDSVRREGGLTLLIPAGVTDPWAKRPKRPKFELIHGRNDEPERDSHPTAG